ncbi:uncharacterized protein STEHIDRAFT_151323 [Stereum hirsutum FP-91666 SS1]|uniref:uncharacterized protein n=1 Tax=Stereum hirsutum (strain FP-91666) TaxID=721885 RepID=UPI0004410147|nr:uncharacterized protein STEHIDRAFT_151323 [Stereum hirsutum FP-91666 SS1]EIM91970.1 hypothetical protein STEHIDRAFT_151323 [Stereum hirsutum FP-91666 SS1]
MSDYIVDFTPLDKIIKECDRCQGCFSSDTPFRLYHNEGGNTHNCYPKCTDYYESKKTTRSAAITATLGPSDTTLKKATSASKRGEATLPTRAMPGSSRATATPAVQVNISVVCGGRTLERSISGGQGGIHPDVKDHPDSWTLTHTLYLFPPGTDLGPFFLIHPGLYIKPCGIFIKWTAFKGGHPHSGSALTVYNLELFHCWQDTFTVEA